MTAVSYEVEIPANGMLLPGTLVVPPTAKGAVIFAHGSGSSRLSPRNNYVAGFLHSERMATLLFDLLTEKEDLDPRARFDIPLLAKRLHEATRWLATRAEAKNLPLGYFGASTGAAAALMAAAEAKNGIAAVVSRGGRPDLAGKRHLETVTAPTLLIVGGNDHTVLELNRQAFAHMQCEKELSIVPGATHLFEETGAMEQVARLAAGWFSRWLCRTGLD
ncbi:MAG: alpha/beta family hydrolase [Burkholderiaceae bacterium]|nr:alpha/beta family hydrolase [Burkholderiaceae bacterium]